MYNSFMRLLLGVRWVTHRTRRDFRFQNFNSRYESNSRYVRDIKKKQFDVITKKNSPMFCYENLESISNDVLNRRFPSCLSPLFQSES